ncbi:MAG: hypothetical protein KJ767_03605 [Nanoarchaeota archaeon]|nr:hypothetical protein [Nanoarchaeota archaeon]
MNMNKKAQITEGWMWLIRILFLIMPLSLAIAFFMSSFVSSVDVTPIEATILAERVDTCFVNNGILDMNDFNTATLKNCYNSEDVNAKLELSFKEVIPIKTDNFDVYWPLCNLKGKDVPYCNEFREYVLVKDGDEYYPGSLDIKITLRK